MRARSFPAELGDDVRWIEVRNPPPTGRLRHRLEGRRAARIGADPDEPRLFRPGWIEREPRSLNAVVREHLDEEAMTALRRIEPCAREARADGAGGCQFLTLAAAFEDVVIVVSYISLNDSRAGRAANVLHIRLRERE
jgi:hypothetical protein